MPSFILPLAIFAVVIGAPFPYRVFLPILFREDLFEIELATAYFNRASSTPFKTDDRLRTHGLIISQPIVLNFVSAAERTALSQK